MPRLVYVSCRIIWSLICVLALQALCHAHELLGANLNGIADYSRSHEFVDVVKQARPFLKIGSFDDTQAANLAAVGADGWPTGDFRLFAMAAQQDTLGLAGTYTVVFTGKATLSTTGGGAGTFTKQSYDAASNSTRAELSFPAGAENLMIDFRGTQGGITNLRVLRPGFDPATAPTFTSAYLQHVKRFNVLRFMDWMKTNEAQGIVSWADRTTSNKLKTEARIARWETAIELANTVGRDIWINIPVNANDDYVTQLATLLRDQLASNLNVYVEYSNEVWNGQFPQFAINFDAAVAEVTGNSASVLKFDGTTDKNTWANRRVAIRLKGFSDIFKSVWGATAINTRVRPVLAGQMATSFRVSEGLRVIDEGLNLRPNTVFYALAGAPYIFADAKPDAAADEVSGLTLDKLLSGMQAGVDNAPSEDSAYQYLTHAGLGAWYGLKVLAYEGGFDNFGSANVATKRLANLDARIRDICSSYLKQWYSYGFEQFLWFNAGAASYNTPFGMWPLLEDMSNRATPKNQCMDDTIAGATPTVTIGTSVHAASIAAGTFRGSSNANASLSGLAAPFGFPGYVEYLLRADSAGSYRAVFRGNGPAGEGFRVKLNNALVSAKVALPVATGDATAITMTLRKGLNALRIERATGASWLLDRFSLSPLSAGSVTVSGPLTRQSLSASITPSSTSLGQAGHAFLAAILPGNNVLLLTPAGWVAFDARSPGALRSGKLESTNVDLVANANLTALTGTAIYLGYGRGASAAESLADMLATGSLALAHTISP